MAEGVGDFADRFFTVVFAVAVELAAARAIWERWMWERYDRWERDGDDSEMNRRDGEVVENGS